MRTGRDATIRRVSALGNHVLPLDYDIPPPKTPEGLMDKTSAVCIKIDQWSLNRSQAKSDRARQLVAIRQGGVDSGNLQTQFGIGGRQARRAARRANRDERRGRVPMPSRNMMVKVAIADRKEANASIGVIWIVVIDASQDDQIEGKEIVDNKESVEVVPESEWEEQLDWEDEQDKKDLDEYEMHKYNNDKAPAYSEAGPSQY